MNVENRLRRPAFFIPDPWTRTPTDGSLWSRAIADAVSQAVNDNAQSKVTPRSAAELLGALARFAQPKHYVLYAQLALASRAAPWRKALFLDLFLHDLHSDLFKTTQPHLSTLFLNAGAHIQHHYLFNAAPLATEQRKNPAWYVNPNADPFLEMLRVYDRILGDYLDLPGVDLLIATGLTQRPYDRVKFYYRLKDHSAFLRTIGVSFSSVVPRMTRDFLVEFDTEEDAKRAELLLGGLVSERDSERVFDQIDNRGRSLFVTLSYPHEIRPGHHVRHPGGTIDLAEYVAFVALKNGMHDERGFAFFQGSIRKHAPKDGDHVKCLYDSMRQYFA